MLRRSVQMLAAAILLGIPQQAFAALGGDASSIDADRIRMQGALLRISRTDAFTIHEVQSSTGTAIREYVSPSGTVFAVAWSGPWMPDMRQLLGPYFERFQRGAAAARRSRRGHGPLRIDDGEIVAQVSGHARAFSGVATVPRLVPNGVRADAIR
ncbi:MAG TPA: DUF2844 domain-containing protein [Vicinamibacterales bacterium]|nr:DUF2844 domain-containing protein [Vicinamibacterales bacterium]